MLAFYVKYVHNVQEKIYIRLYSDKNHALRDFFFGNF